MRARFWIFLILITGWVTGLWLYTNRNSRHSLPEPVHEMKMAQDFRLQNQKREWVSLSGFRGKVVLLNFWSTTCPPCVSEMDGLNKLAQHYDGKDFVILGVSLDSGGWRVVESFLKKNPIQFPILLDENFHVSDSYEIFRVPATLVIDPQGQMLERIEGARDWMEPSVIQKIDRLLASKNTETTKS